MLQDKRAPKATICSLHSCCAHLNPSHDSIVRVRIAPKAVARLARMTLHDNPVAWSRKGVGQLHSACWDGTVEKAKQDLQAASSAKRKPGEAGRRASKRVRMGNSNLESGTAESSSLETPIAPSKDRLFFAQKIVTAAETAERKDPPNSVREAGLLLAEAIRKHASIMFFTGAGISTAAGIGDYRGLFGKWNEQDLMVSESSSAMSSRPESDESEPSAEEEDNPGVPYEQLRPTLTHEAIAWIVASKPAGAVTVVTQNCDGLHELTGLGQNVVAALHGCVFTEACTNPSCGKRISRPFYVLDDTASEYYEKLQDAKSAKARRALGPPPPAPCVRCEQCELTHTTGRFCPTPCGAPLRDTIIHFGDDLEESVWNVAESASRKSTLRVVLGSTVLVTPASTLVTERVGKKTVVVCNRQATGADDIAKIRAYCDCDALMEQVMRELLDGSAERYNEWVEETRRKRQQYDKERVGCQEGEGHTLL
ncbi:DHS-like NAD/FAD-binding domain-containing protein [Zopfochytrium polystomum]|nr:DHS-like NAD/FAD-binding domain-containing protein [Zopfochytrium polystomum]